MRIDPNRWWCTFDKQIFIIKEIQMDKDEIYWTELITECCSEESDKESRESIKELLEDDDVDDSLYDLMINDYDY